MSDSEVSRIVGVNDETDRLRTNGSVDSADVLNSFGAIPSDEQDGSLADTVALTGALENLLEKLFGPIDDPAYNNQNSGGIRFFDPKVGRYRDQA